MNFKSFRTSILSATAVFAFFTFVFIGCKPDPKPEDNGDKPDKPQVDTPTTSMVQVGGAVFSVPSPFQTSTLIKETGATYNSDILNAPANVANYKTNFKKALNLGVYGADIGYVTIYDHTQDALKYLRSIRKLSDELGVSSAFDAETIQRFEANLGKKDSLLNMVSVGFRAADAFLEDDQRQETAALILAGGWIESLYFSVKIAQQTGDKALMKRIGEQKYTLDNLIKALNPYSQNSEEYDDLLDQLYELAYDYDAVNVDYTYVKPTVKAEEKTTVLKSKTEVQITKEHLDTISEKLEALRNQVIGNQS